MRGIAIEIYVVALFNKIAKKIAPCPKHLDRLIQMTLNAIMFVHLCPKPPPKKLGYGSQPNQI